MNRQFKRYLSIIIFCLFTLSITIYYLMGGFDPVEIYGFEGTDRMVVGVPYFGKHKSKKLDSIRQAIVSDLRQEKLKGKLTIVDYHYDSRDSVKFFVGASFDEIKDVISIPPSYDLQEFSTNRIYKLFITQSKFTRPTPEKVEALMRQKADAEDKKLAPFSFELYYEDGSLSVEYWGSAGTTM